MSKYVPYNTFTLLCLACLTRLLLNVTCKQRIECKKILWKQWNLQIWILAPETNDPWVYLNLLFYWPGNQTGIRPVLFLQVERTILGEQFPFMGRSPRIRNWMGSLTLTTGTITLSCMCQTQGPRAKSGPPRHFMWPARV